MWPRRVQPSRFSRDIQRRHETRSFAARTCNIPKLQRNARAVELKLAEMEVHTDGGLVQVAKTVGDCTAKEKRARKAEFSAASSASRTWLNFLSPLDNRGFPCGRVTEDQHLQYDIATGSHFLCTSVLRRICAHSWREKFIREVQIELVTEARRGGEPSRDLSFGVPRLLSLLLSTAQIFFGSFLVSQTMRMLICRMIGSNFSTDCLKWGIFATNESSQPLRSLCKRLCAAFILCLALLT
jgi:hypothetical protein